MTFLQLNYVTEIYNCGSINKAAQNLFVSQSSLSNSIRELEDELGIKIFIRSNRGIILTDSWTGIYYTGKTYNRTAEEG